MKYVHFSIIKYKIEKFVYVKGVCLISGGGGRGGYGGGRGRGGGGYGGGRGGGGRGGFDRDRGGETSFYSS